ncbi:hypothetical protein [Streptomyces sp. AC558_RSS880]|uniref:hypothetical protein n=1 Tax=Streptomyces sp. AC558_RSS880 TaxID=2823687 RepID=UPI001C21A112|nr:hypothetical protein [Streptomyces sp. AC558_RSS880]
MDPNGWINLAGQRVKIGSELANRVITVRLDGHLLHAVHDGLLAKTLPSPFTAGGAHGSSVPVLPRRGFRRPRPRSALNAKSRPTAS